MAKLPLLLLPAALTDDRLHGPIKSELAELIDLRTMIVTGDSLRGAAAELLERAPPRFFIGGTSYGGNLALEVALSAPERVAGLWLMGVNPGVHGNPSGAQAMLDRVVGGAFDEVAAEMAASCIHIDADREASKRACFMNMAQTIGAARFAQQISVLIGRESSIPRLPRLEMPVLLVWGREDKVSPPAHAELIRSHVPGAELVLVANCGHLPTLEQPAVVAAVASGWLRDLI